MIQKQDRKTKTGKTILEEINEYSELYNDTIIIQEDLADMQVLINSIIENLKVTTTSTTELNYITTLINLCMIILEKIHTRIV